MSQQQQSSPNIHNLYKACAHLHSLRLPITKNSTNFAAALKSSLGTPGAPELVNALSSSRAEMINSISSDAADASLQKVDEYLTLLIRFIASLEASKFAVYDGLDVFRLDHELTFEWRGHLTGESMFFSSSSLAYEKLMVLHTKAVLHHDKAKAYLQMDVLSLLSEAGKQLLTAASIMDYVANMIHTEHLQQRLNSKVANPPELDESVCRGLFSYFKASAQAMAAVKGFSNPSTPALVRSRLSLAVVASSRRSLELIASVPAAAGPNFPFLGHIAALRELFTGSAFFYLAQSYLDKQEVGVAMGFCNAAKPHIEIQKHNIYVLAEPGLPNSSYLAGASAYLSESLQSLLSSADRDNRFIHFQTVPALAELPPMPQEASVMNPAAFSLPEPAEAPITFVYMRKKSIFESFFSKSPAPHVPPVGVVVAVDNSNNTSMNSSSSNNNNGSSSSVSGGVAAGNGGGSGHAESISEDERMARELQRQYDAEAAQGGQGILPPQGSNNGLI